MSGALLLVLFVGSWVGFAVWAKTKKRWSATVSVGGGLLVGCLALIAVGMAMPRKGKDSQGSARTDEAAPDVSAGSVGGQGGAIDGRCKRFTQMTPILYTQPIRRMESMDKASAIERQIAGGGYEVLSIYVNQNQHCMAKIRVNGVYEGTSFGYVLDGPLADKDANLGAD